jgi:hypothetical protein
MIKVKKSGTWTDVSIYKRRTAGVWTNVVLGKRLYVAPPPPDPMWGSVRLLLNANGDATEGTGITPLWWPDYDSVSRNPYIPSATGGLFGGHSGDTPVIDPIQMPPYYTLVTGVPTGPVTLEASLYLYSSDIARIMAGFTAQIVSDRMSVEYADYGSGNKFYLTTEGTFGAKKKWSLGATLSEGWFRFAYVRNASNIINGWSGGIKLAENEFSSSSSSFTTGAHITLRTVSRTTPQDYSDISWWSHKVCEVRLTAGARYSADYTLDVTPFPNY